MMKKNPTSTYLNNFILKIRFMPIVVLNQTVFKDTIHHWPLDDPSNIINLQSDKHGSISGKVTAVHGPVNTALATDGTTGQITLADLKYSCILASPSCADGFTLRFWLKFPRNDNKEKRVFLSIGHDQPNSRGFQVMMILVGFIAHVILHSKQLP